MYQRQNTYSVLAHLDLLSHCPSVYLFVSPATCSHHVTTECSEWYMSSPVVHPCYMSTPGLFFFSNLSIVVSQANSFPTISLRILSRLALSSTLPTQLISASKSLLLSSFRIHQHSDPHRYRFPAESDSLTSNTRVTSFYDNTHFTKRGFLNYCSQKKKT